VVITVVKEAKLEGGVFVLPDELSRLVAFVDNWWGDVWK
jgi:hypothetical protein